MGISVTAGALTTVFSGPTRGGVITFFNKFAFFIVFTIGVHEHEHEAENERGHAVGPMPLSLKNAPGDFPVSGRRRSWWCAKKPPRLL